MSPILGVNAYLFIATVGFVLVIGVSCAYQYWQDKGEIRRHANRMADDPFYGGGE